MSSSSTAKAAVLPPLLCSRPSKLLLLPNTRTNCCKLCAIDPGRGSVEVFALDNATRSGNGQELMKCGSNLIFIPFDSSGRRCVAEVSVLDCNVLSV